MYNRQLDTFLTVADCGSFGKAAEQLYISTPATIQQINLLEDRLGVSLFSRSNRGVKLTAAGQSIYQDAKTVIRISEEAVAKARHLAESSEHTVRIGTSLLFKCRKLPDVWATVAEKCPDLKLEVMPIPEHETRANAFHNLGTKYDIREGVFCTISHKAALNFHKLMQTPLCCAVGKDHRLAKYSSLTLRDLNGEHLIMPMENISVELDAFRDEIRKNHPTIKILDFGYYGVDTFAQCELSPYVLITQEVYRDIHPELVTIPLETDITLP